MTMQNSKSKNNIYQNTVGLWWDSNIYDWHLPPEKNIEMEFFVSGNKKSMNVKEVMTFIDSFDGVIVTTGLDMLMAYFIWTNNKVKYKLDQMLEQSKLIPLDILEDTIAYNYKNIWPAPQSPTTVIESNSPGSKKAQETKTIFHSILDIKVFYDEIIKHGNYLYGMVYDLFRRIASLFCGWQGIHVDTKTLLQLYKKETKAIKKDPSKLDDKQYATWYRNIVDIYESVLENKTIHPAYILDPFGRTYTKAPNIQILGGAGDSLRSLLVAVKNNSLFYSDASTANLHPLAEIWRQDYKNSNLAEDINDPFDLHFRTGVYILYPDKFTEIKEKIAEGVSWITAAKEAGIKNYKTVRGLGKDINFAIPNGVSLSTMKLNARTRGFELLDKDYRRFRRQYDIRYPIEQWSRDGKGYKAAKTVTGRIYFTDRQPKWSSFRIQGTIADLFSSGIYLAALHENQFPALWIHDSVVYEARDKTEVSRAINHFRTLAKDWFPKTKMKFNIENLGKQFK
mgnify:CR=1 FL=1